MRCLCVSNIQACKHFHGQYVRNESGEIAKVKEIIAKTPSPLGDGCPDVIGARVRGKPPGRKYRFDGIYGAVKEKFNLTPSTAGVF